ncbi:MAG: hypothetical protein RLZZ53_3495 [Acidobacteriota bacterium]|jgi:low temperature requirement protein LtrA
MSDHSLASGPLVFAPMRARSPQEGHRVATPLELFFDLVFVVAIAQAAAGFHHSISEAHIADGLVTYLMAFFGIWWAWMNFTWFASAYDCDDVPYRLAVFAQITGALVFAAGISSMFSVRSLNVAIIGGYVIMRLAQVTQWLRAARSDPERSPATLRYAIGIAVLQVLWIGLAQLPAAWIQPGFLVLIVLEMAVPAWAEATVQTTWHPHHIAERYALFTIIVLGESILSATVAVQTALASGERFAALAPVICGGLLIVFGMWWLYFYRPFRAPHEHRTRLDFLWGYGHYVVFASSAAVGAGLAAAVDDVTHKAHISHVAAGAAVAIPVALYVLSLSLLHYSPSMMLSLALSVIAAVLVLLSPLAFGSGAIVATGLILAALLAFKIARYHRSSHA